MQIRHKGSSAQEEQLSLRYAVSGDRKIIFKLINEKAVREAAFDNMPIEWKTHCDWYNARMANANPFYIIMKDGQPCGYVRFENDPSGEDSAEDLNVSIVLSPEARGQGIGKYMLASCCSIVLASGMAKKIHAIVKLTNQASMALFRSCHFSEAEIIWRDGQAAMHFICQQ